MFRIFSVIFISAIIPLVWCEKEKYTTKFDNIDLQEVVKSDRLLKNYVDCLLDKGRCTPDGVELRKNIVDAIQTDCGKCSKKQKDGSDFLMKYLIDNKPEYWNPLEKKYDPEGMYKSKYLESKGPTTEFEKESQST